MFNLEILKQKLEPDIEVQMAKIEEKENKFISFYHRKSGFYYKIHILLKEQSILLDFHDIYNKKEFDHKRRIEMSVIAHALKEVIQKTSKHRVRILSGLSKISWDWLIIENIEHYQKRRSREFVQKMKNDVITLFETSIEKTKNEPMDEKYEYELYLAGEDGFYLFELMDELGIAKIESKRKVDLKIEFMPCYLNKRILFVKEVIEGLKELGFQVQLFSKRI